MSVTVGPRGRPGAQIKSQKGLSVDSLSSCFLGGRGLILISMRQPGKGAWAMGPVGKVKCFQKEAKTVWRAARMEEV